MIVIPMKTGIQTLVFAAETWMPTIGKHRRRGNLRPGWYDANAINFHQ